MYSSSNSNCDIKCNLDLEKKCMELEREYNAEAALIAASVKNDGKILPKFIAKSVKEGIVYSLRGLFLASVYTMYPNIAPGSVYRYAYLYLTLIPPVLYYSYIYTTKSIVKTYTELLKSRIDKLELHMAKYAIKLGIMLMENIGACSVTLNMLTSFNMKNEKQIKLNRRAISARKCALNVVYWGHCLIHTVIYALCILWMLDIK